MDSDRRVIDDAVVLIEDGQICAVERAVDLPVPGGAEVVDATDHAVIPGLVNAHTHGPQILLRGGPSHDRHLYDWLFNILYPGLGAYDAADLRCATTLFATEALLHGVTTVVDNEDAGTNDMPAHAATTIDALRSTGIRAVYARMFADRADPALDRYVAALRGGDTAPPAESLMVPTERVLADLDDIVRRFDGCDEGRIRVWPAPAIASIVSERALRRCQEIARERGSRWTMHLAEDRRERQVQLMGSVEYLASIGGLDERLVAAHCIDIEPREVRLLRSAGTTVSTQPASNAFLGAGIAPVPELLAAGVTVGIGTDDTNCSDTVDVFGSMKLLAMIHRASREDASAITPERIVEMATIDGAHVIGMGDTIGSIEVGKRADLVLLDLRSVSMTPAWDLCAALVFMGPARAVRTVLVDGRVVVRDGRPTYLGAGGERELTEEAWARAARITDAAGLERARPWRTFGR